MVPSKVAEYQGKEDPRGPNLRLFRSTTNRFRDKRSSKIGNAPGDPKLHLNTQQSEVPYVH